MPIWTWTRRGALPVVSDSGILFGLWNRLSPVTAIATIPIAVWEFSLVVI